MNNSFEILAPAGDMDNLVAAVYSGANSVYLGVRDFNARASAANFSYEELKTAVEFCHARNVTVNVTLNTILYDNELENFKETVKQVALCGVDAVILQDLAAAEIVKNIAPSLARHGSTQMAVHTLEGAQFLAQMGYTRVILARELSLERVEHITKNCGIETEVFIHGALCVCVSGQCYASTFLGGRSGNRGRCAGTCRLPMSARADMEDNHLSLKDLCALDMLTELKAIGVKAAKIEGRLRTPEYVAGAVDASLQALKGEDFDKQTLADTFSRSGFTNGFLEGKMDKSVFGVRTKEESKRTKETLPQLRQLYRREGQYVPVEFNFKMGETTSTLTITDGTSFFDETISEPIQDSKGDFEKSLRAALEKLGGTPFYAKEMTLNVQQGKYLPLSAVNEARRCLVEKLLKARSNINEYKIFDYSIGQFAPREQTAKLIARFETQGQIPMERSGKFEYIILPIDQYETISETIKDKVVLELSRDMFNGTEALKDLIEKSSNVGYDKFCVQNVGHLPLVTGYTVFSSFTLNVSNSLSAKLYSDFGVSFVTLSPEIALEQIKRINPAVKTIVYAYGHVPLMITKSCALQNVRTCVDCEGRGFLVDRKGMQMPLRCHGKINGYREIFNPIPLYMGERSKEINSDYLSLNFTIESRQRAKEVIDMFTAKSSFDCEFTRGLYYKASI